MRTPGPARSVRLVWLQPKALGRVREGKGLRKRGTHDSTVRGASQSGSSRRLAAVGRAHASRVCFIFITPSTVLSTFSIALLGFPLLLALDLFSLPLLSLSLPLLCLLPASLLLPLQAMPSLPSLWRLRPQLRQGLAGGSPRQNPIRARTVSPTPCFSPGLGNTERVGAMQCGRGGLLQSPFSYPFAPARGDPARFQSAGMRATTL